MHQLNSSFYSQAHAAGRCVDVAMLLETDNTVCVDLCCVWRNRALSVCKCHKKHKTSGLFRGTNTCLR